MHAATRSPFQTASPGTPSPSTGNPSVRTYDGRTSSLASARRSASTLATCMPSRSHSSGPTTTTDQATARRSDLGVAPLAGLLGEQLGVGEPRDDPPVTRRQDRGRCDQRAGAGAAPGLVDARDRVEPAPPQRALVAVEPRVAAHGQPPGQRGHGPTASKVSGRLMHLEVAERPDDREHLADDVLRRARSRRRGHRGAPGCRRTGSGCRPCTQRYPSGTFCSKVMSEGSFARPRGSTLVQGGAVDGDPALVVAAGDGVAADADDALDQVTAGREQPERPRAPWPATLRACGASASSSQPPGSAKTTMSPRCGDAPPQ